VLGVSILHLFLMISYKILELLWCCGITHSLRGEYYGYLKNVLYSDTALSLQREKLGTCISNFMWHSLLVKWFRHHKCLTQVSKVQFQSCQINDNKTAVNRWWFVHRLAAASDKVYQLLAHGRLFSPGTPAFCITKTGRHDIAEILLKVALITNN
jgi:hypothetical protein